MSEFFAEALLQLQADLALGLHETNCPWLDQEGCCIHSLRQCLSLHDKGLRYLDHGEAVRLACWEGE